MLVPIYLGLCTTEELRAMGHEAVGALMTNNIVLAGVVSAIHTLAMIAVAKGDESVRYKPEAPGAYRAEVRMQPRHLKRYLGAQAAIAEEDRIWIYSNAIYIE